MTQTDATWTPWTPATFLTPTRLGRLSKNQQAHAETIITDFNDAYQQVAATDQTWTITGLKAALTALPMLVDRPHNYFVAVVPVLSAYIQAQVPAEDWPALQAELVAARPQLVEKHTTQKVNQEQRAYEDVVAQVEGWVQAMAAQPQVQNLSAANQRAFGVIVHVTAELLLTGRHLQPAEWDAKALASVMFGPFTHLLDKDQREPHLYQLIPFALTTLFTYLKDQLKYAGELQDWVRTHHTALTTMYDPEMETFFEELTTAMQRAGIDTQDHAAVDQFTKAYLREHPERGQKLFATDQQLKAVGKRRGSRPAFRRKRRR
ncbi:hypothetical protein [Levilactobacillus namurensis]|uniref:hypothetical protein n=1 Tax=Levilactobacillus namurensis TaxID=380393 RepID=UPI001DA69FA1|nr:hypothetical protein [Levilactobacillus namurensis]HJE44478.1 hypothetical protein [Levilactobacillus namurensis]